MLKNTLLACIFLFSIITVTGQSFSNTKELKNRGFISLNVNPTVIVIVDSVSYEIESKKADDIKNEWIEKVYIMKDETSKKLHGNKNGVIYIYTNKKYKKEILKEIENTGIK
ncbi:MAG: hypothetical protein QM503_14950 [Bacteroidota bacterium]